MPHTNTAHTGTLLLAVHGALTIFQAAERKPELLHVLSQAQQGQDLSLDLSGVDEIDAAGLQLLLLLQREAQRSGRRVLVQAYSPAVLAVFDLLQLHAAFGAGEPIVAEGRP